MALARAHRIAAATLWLLPLGLTGLLAALRPDLMGPLIGGLFGRLGLIMVAVLSTLGAGLALLAWWGVARVVRPDRRWQRRALTVVLGGVPVLLFTLPALFLVLFAPIVNAFTFGSGEPGQQARTPPAGDVEPIFQTFTSPSSRPERPESEWWRDPRPPAPRQKGLEPQW